MTFEVFDDRACALGEGPLWHPERQQYFWFDIHGSKMLSRIGKEQFTWQFDENVSAAGWIDRDTLLVATETGLRRVDLTSGEHEPVCALEADNPVTRSNDGRADPQGGFWIGTMGKNFEFRAGGIYRFYRGEIELLYPEITVPNSICFAPDGRTAYYTDTWHRRIRMQPLDEAGWPDGPSEVFCDLREDGLNPDGAVVDSEGGVWSAQWGAGRVARFLPDGRFDRAIDVGGTHTTCPAFGGPDLDEMIVTSASDKLDRPDALQGAVFRVAPGVRGQAEHRVIA